MKKACLIILILILLCTLVSCNGEPRAKVVDTGVISYNGSIYRVVKIDNDFYQYYIYDNPPFTKEPDSKVVGRYGIFMMPIEVFESEFGDNVLRVRNIGGYTGYYFKEGYEFPSYKEVVIEKLVVGFRGDELLLDAETKWTDIIDFEKEFYFEDSKLSDCNYCFCLGILRDYSLICSGMFVFFKIDNSIYARINSRSDVLYEVTAEYQQSLNDIITRYNIKY